MNALHTEDFAAGERFNNEPPRLGTLRDDPAVSFPAQDRAAAQDAGTEAGAPFASEHGQRDHSWNLNTEATMQHAGESPATPAAGSPTPHQEAGALDGVPRAGGPLTDWQRETALHRWHRLERYDDLMAALGDGAAVLSEAEISDKLGEPNASMHKLLKRCPPCAEHGRRACCDAQFRLLVPPPKPVKKPRFLPTADELACVREIYARLDESEARGRGLGASRVTAFRLAAKGDDPRISDAFRAAVLDRANKDLPPALCRLLDVPASVLARVRDVRSTFTSYISTPRGRHYYDVDGLKMMRAGTSLQADDGTLNFYATIPWPFGGDKCSDKFGVRLGRWQMLAVVDARWLFCPIFHIVARPNSAYRGQDVAALLGSAMIQIVKPEWWCLERGSWESDIVQRALQIADVRVTRAWESKQKAGVEEFFDRLWTPLSLMPGHAGRDRARFKQIQDLALACQAGRHDPRQWFRPLAECVPDVAKAVQFVNSEPIESKMGWGKWVPEERWNTQLAETPPRRLPGALSLAFAREQRVWTVRGAGLGGMVEGPFLKFPVFFQCEQLWAFEGCRVKCFFDPYAEPVLGTLVLEDNAWREFRKGHVIAADVPGIADPLALPAMADFSGMSRPEAERSLQTRKAIARAVRVETWNFLGERSTHARIGNGVTQSEIANPPSQIANGGGPAALPPQLCAPPAPTVNSRAALFGG